MSELCALKAATLVGIAAKKKYDDAVRAVRDAADAADAAREELIAASEAREAALATFMAWLPTEEELCPPPPSPSATGSA